MTEETNEFYDYQKQMMEEALGIKRFHTIDGETLMEKQIEHREQVVAELLPAGMTLLAGPSKAGKSFLVYEMCVAVASGAPFLGFPTRQGTVLYLAFEDTEDRLQQRGMMIADALPPCLHFSNEIYKLGEGLIEALEQFVTDHPDTRLIAIDMLHYIRPESKNANMYEKDCADLVPLHQFSQRHDLSLLLVQHTRKTQDGDEFNAASGSTGLAGACDHYITLKRPNRLAREAQLFFSGRETADTCLRIVLDKDCIWRPLDHYEYRKEEICDIVRDTFLFVMLNGFNERKETREYTATEIANGIYEMFRAEFKPNMITKMLTQHHEQLESLGLKFHSERSNKSRCLRFDESGTELKHPDFVFDNRGDLVDMLIFDDTDFGDGVTPLTGDDDILPSAVTDPSVTADSHTESSCHAVTERF